MSLMSKTPAGGIDPNRTVWQRLNDRLQEVMSRQEADALTEHLHPYVVAERRDASA